MADNYTKVISFVADNKQYLTVLKETETANQRLAQNFGADFAQASKIVSTSLNKIGQKKTFSKPDKEGNITESIKYYEQLNTVLQMADGSYVKYTEDIVEQNGVRKIEGASVSDVTDRYQKLSTVNAKTVQQSSQLATNFGNVKDITQKYSKELSGLGSISKVVGQNITKISGNTQQLGTVVKTSNGKFLQLKETVTRTADGLQTVSRTVQDVSSQYSKTAVEAEKMNKTHVTLTENIARLASRAALTIPLWLALRGIFMEFIAGVKEGFSEIAKFDLALQKVKRNLQGTTSEIKGNLETLRKEVTKFSLSTGIATTDITEAIKKFASLGFSFEESMAGGLGAAKLSKVLFGEAAETADAFARALNILIDRSKGAEDPITQMNKLFSLTAKLEESNQFEIKEVNESLKNFANTAKSFNVSGKDTLAILATLGTNLLEGAKGGTLASTAFQQMFMNLKDVGKTLGVDVNPKADTTVEMILKIASSIDSLNQSNPVAATEAISKLFGGVKGAKVVRSLISDLGRLKENLQLDVDANYIDKQLNSVTNSVSGQIDIFKNLKVEINKAFVSGAVGGEEWLDTLKQINATMLSLVGTANVVGKGLKLVFADLPATVANPTFILDKIKIKSSKELEKINEVIVNGLRGRLSDVELKDLIIKLDQKGIKKFKISERTMNQLGVQMSKQLKDGVEISPIQAEIEAKASKKEQEIEELTKQTELEETRQELSKILIANEVDKLKAIGASNSELIKAEQHYRNILKIELDAKEKLQEKLNLEKAINDEKRLQSKLGSDSMKLFKVAQEQGVDIAKRLGDVLAGNVDFSTFTRQGGKALEVFKKDFSDLYEQQQALSFFKGEKTPGIEKLRGGANIAIQEEAIRKPIDTSSLLLQASKNNIVPQKTAQVISPNVQQTNNITNNITVGNSNNELIEEIIKSFQSAKIQKALSQMVFGDKASRNF